MDDPPGTRPLSPSAGLLPDELEATLVLLRHGESTAIVEGRFQGRLDTPLSPLGTRQAELVGGRLARPDAPPRMAVPAHAPVEIVHSPLGRTTETARAVAAALEHVHGLSARALLRPEPGLIEIDQGVWEGLRRDEVVARYGPELDAWRRAPTQAQAPGGERVLDAGVRARIALLDVLTRLGAARPSARPEARHTAGYPPSPGPDTPWTLLVAHDGILKVTLLTLLDVPLDRFWSFPWALTGLTIVELARGRAILRGHNLTDHLAPLQTQESTADTLTEAATRARDNAGSL